MLMGIHDAIDGSPFYNDSKVYIILLKRIKKPIENSIFENWIPISLPFEGVCVGQSTDDPYIKIDDSGCPFQIKAQIKEFANNLDLSSVVREIINQNNHKYKDYSVMVFHKEKMKYYKEKTFIYSEEFYGAPKENFIVATIKEKRDLLHNRKLKIKRKDLIQDFKSLFGKFNVHKNFMYLSGETFAQFIKTYDRNSYEDKSHEGFGKRAYETFILFNLLEKIGKVTAPSKRISTNLLDLSLKNDFNRFNAQKALEKENSYFLTYHNSPNVQKNILTKEEFIRNKTATKKFMANLTMSPNRPTMIMIRGEGLLNGKMLYVTQEDENEFSFHEKSFINSPVDLEEYQWDFMSQEVI